MINLDLRLQKPLEDYVEYFDTLTPRGVPLLTKFTDFSMAFQDPVYNVRGNFTAQKVLKRRFEVYPSGKYVVYDFTWGRRPATAYLRWTFSYNLKGGLLVRPERKSTEGMVEIGFSPDGKVCSHAEFWQDTSLFDLKAYRKPL